MPHDRDLDALRPRIEDYLRQKGLPLTKPFRCLHPDHEDKNPSMSYHRAAHNVHCFGCNATYDVFDLIGLDYTTDRFPEQLRIARDLFGVPTAPPATPTKANITPMPARAAASGEPSAYLLARGLSAETIARAAAFERDGRVYFPFIEGGRTVGFCGRALTDDIEPRYKNSAGSLPLWNGDALRALLHAASTDPATVYITEGIIDALALQDLGATALALCGSQNWSKLLHLLDGVGESASSLRFVTCGDPDDAGRKMNDKLQTELTARGYPCDILPLTESDTDVAALLLRDRARLQAMLSADPAPADDYSQTSAAAALDTFFLERERRAGRSGVMTGFAALDDVLDGGLHAGLHVIGAISSLGKTTFVLQIADWIAEHEHDVLFFSLEQGRFELMAKSLSRLSARLDPAHAFTVRELLSGAPPRSLAHERLLRDTRELYAQAAHGLFLREGLADIGPAEMRRAVQRHIASRGRAPVVIVDYLQILKPWEPRATDKQNVDHAVVELKRLSRDFDIPVIAVSSFNRDNYRAAVSMEAFKESGAVEYSADVLFGLQLQGAGDRDFDVNRAKLMSPRRVELVMLKNRNGIPYAKIPLLYDAKHGSFTQDDAQRGKAWA